MTVFKFFFGCFFVSNLLFASTAKSESTIYTDRQEFEAALDGPTLLEGFDDAIGKRPTVEEFHVPNARPTKATIHFSDFTLTHWNPRGRGINDSLFQHILLSPFGTPLDIDYELVAGFAGGGTRTNPITLSFSFEQPIQAFGVDVRDLDQVGLLFQTDHESGTVLPIGGPEEIRFWGFITSKPFHELTFLPDRDARGGIENVGFDDILVQFVPEPQIAGLLLCAMMSALSCVRSHRLLSD